MELNGKLAWLIAILNILLVSVGAPDLQAQERQVDGYCVWNNKWSAQYTPGQGGYSSATPCGGDGTAITISLRCSPTEPNRILVAVNSNQDGTAIPENVTIDIDGHEFSFSAKLETTGTQKTLNFSVAPGSPAVAGLAKGDKARIIAGNVATGIPLNGSGKAIQAMLASCNLRIDASAFPPQRDVALQERRSPDQFTNRIAEPVGLRNRAKSSSMPCNAESSVIAEVAASTTVGLASDSGPVGSFTDIVWNAEVVQESVPAYLIVAFDKPVRFKGDGFYALMEGTPGPFGADWRINSQRVIIPLQGHREPGNNAFAFQSVLSGNVAIEWRVVGHVRRCDQPVQYEVQKLPFKAFSGQARVRVGNDAVLPDPVVEFVSSDRNRRLLVRDGGFSLLTHPEGFEIATLEGVKPEFSPTGRFITFTLASGRAGTDLEFRILDAIDGAEVGIVEGEELAWSHSDSFLVAAVGGIRNPVVLDRRYAGLRGAPDTPDSDGVRFDLENNRVQTHSSFFQSTGISFQPLATMPPNTQVKLESDFERIRDFARSQTVVETTPPYHWELTSGMAYHHVHPAHLANLRRSVGRETWAEPALQEIRRRHLMPSMTNFERLVADGGTASAGKATPLHASVRSLDLDPVDPEASGGLAALYFQTGLQPLNPVPATFSEHTKVLIDGGVLGNGVRFLEGNMRDATKLLREDFSDLNCLIGVNSVSNADRLPINHYAIGRAEVDKVYQGDLGCDDGFNRSRRTRIKCGNDQFDYIDAGLHRGWRLDIETNGVSAHRWLVDGKPYWFIQLHCQTDAGDFDLFQSRFYLVGTAADGEQKVLQLKTKRTTTAGNSEEWIGLGSYRGDGSERYQANAFANGLLLLLDREERALVRFDMKMMSHSEPVALDQPELISDLAVDAGSGVIVQTNRNGTIAFLDAENGTKFAQGALRDDEWIIWDSFNNFDSSPEGARLVRITFAGMPGEEHVFHQFQKQLHIEGLLARHLAGEKFARPVIQSPPRLATVQVQQFADQVAIEIDISPGTSVSEFRIFQDGVLTDRVKHDGGFAAKFETRRLLGSRWLSILAVDADGISSVAHGRDLGPDARGSGKLLSVHVGIDAYQEPSLRLNGASLDAETLAAAMEGQSKAGPGSDAILMKDAQASREAILAALKAAVDNAGAADTVLFSYAGHGLRDTQGRFFLTTPSSNLGNLSETAIKWSEISAILQRSQARIIVLLDACQAGTAGTEFFASNDSATGELLGGVPTNIVVFAASKAREFSFEAPSGKGGVFSQAVASVISAERSSHDLNHNGVIEVSELVAAVKRKVILEGKAVREHEARNQGLQRIPTQTPFIARNEMIGEMALF